MMILAYHEVVPKPQSYRYAVTLTSLDRHLELVARVQPVTHCLISSQTVTFDDGHVSNFRFAVPLLAKYKMSALFFVIGNFVGNRSDYMTWGQVKELVSLGHEVQSHGWSHVPLTQCTDTKLEEELLRSRETLEDKLGIRIDAVSVPHGRWNRRVLEGCAVSGYRRVFSSDPWLRPHERNGVILTGRLVVDQSLADEQLKLLLQENPRAVRYLQFESLGKHAMRQILGDRLYHQLWCRLSGWKGPVDLREDGGSSQTR